MLNVGPLSLDLQELEAKVYGKTIDLTLREFELLKYLAKRPGQVVTRKELLDEVWGYSNSDDERIVEITIRRIKDKIEIEPRNPTILLTKMGIGYYLNDNKKTSTFSTSNTEDVKSCKEETIIIWNEKIPINTSYIEYYKLKRKFEEKAQNTKQCLMENINTITYELTTVIFQDILKKCEDDIKEIMQEFFEEKIYTERIENYKKSGYIKINSAFQDLISYQHKVEYQASQELEQEFRMIDKKARRYNSWDYTILGPMPGEKKKKIQRSNSGIIRKETK